MMWFNHNNSLTTHTKICFWHLDFWAEVDALVASCDVLLAAEKKQRIKLFSENVGNLKNWIF